MTLGQVTFTLFFTEEQGITVWLPSCGLPAVFEHTRPLGWRHTPGSEALWLPAFVAAGLV